jgi:hypothetical protein
LINDLFEQRWRDKRASWAPRHALFDPREYHIALVPEKAAKHFIVRHHYSGTYPAARCRIGLFRGDDLVGVAVFSVPASQKVITRYADIDPMEGVELGRFVLLDCCEFNAESWFLSRAFKLLRRELGTRFCLSFSDPVPRHDADGELVKPGHVGQIYQALNAKFYGRASKATLLLLPSGRVMSPRSLGKVRREERGQDYAIGQLVRGGAPEPMPGESGESYVRRIEPCFQKIRHPGNLAYGWSFDKRVDVKLPALPYVKLTS